MGYDPKLDTSPELEPVMAFYFLTIIIILTWMMELGRIVMITKVLLLSSHVAFPREEHLDAAVHAMANVGQRYNSRLIYHPLYPEIDHNVLKECD